jgi:ATP-dependent DNA ligase
MLDGEICSLDKRGRPQFTNLLFHRGNYPCFMAFDLLMACGKDYRRMLESSTSIMSMAQGFRYSSKRASTI